LLSLPTILDLSFSFSAELLAITSEVATSLPSSPRTIESQQSQEEDTSNNNPSIEEQKRKLHAQRQREYMARLKEKKAKGEI